MFTADIENWNTKKVAALAVTNARFAPLHGLPGRPCHPLDRARSTPQARALVTRHERAFAGMPKARRASVCGSAAGRCAPAAFR